MTMRDFCQLVAKRTGVPTHTVILVLRKAPPLLRQRVLAGERIELGGLGVFVRSVRKKSLCRHPLTGKWCVAKRKKYVRFRASKIARGVKG